MNGTQAYNRSRRLVRNVLRMSGREAFDAGVKEDGDDLWTASK